MEGANVLDLATTTEPSLNSLRKEDTLTSSYVYVALPANINLTILYR
jgi:hypothetical protein